MLNACVRFVPIARARLCFLPRKGEFSAFLTLFGEKSHQRVRARKAPKPLRRKKLFSLHAQKSALCHSSTLSNSRPSRHRLFPVEFHSRARVLHNDAKKWEKFCVPCAYKDAFPVLYCVTFWIACFLHPLQYVRRVFGICV